MQVIPAVDVLDGHAVRLMRGDYSKVTHYADDPMAVVEMWAEEGAGLVHVVDLEGARTGTLNSELVERLGSLGVAMQYGGGIRTAEAAEAALSAGILRVVAGSVLLGDHADDFVSRLQPELIVAAIDVRSGRARGSGWRDDGVQAGEAVDRLLSMGLTAILVTGIETDGTMSGPDLSLLEEIRSTALDCELIASGGVGSLDDLDAVAAIGADAVVVGRALYEERFSLADAIRRASSMPPPSPIPPT